MTHVKTVNANQLKDWLTEGQAILVDVREPDEFTQWRIPQALSMPLTSIDKHLPHLAGESRKVVFQCLKGKRGEMAAETAQERFAETLDIYNLSGGIEAWDTAGQATIKHEAAKTIPLMRQVLVAAGALVTLFSVLSLAGVKASGVLSVLIGLGLMFAGITGICGLAHVLKKMPWNK